MNAILSEVSWLAVRILIEAQDMEDAIRIALLHPTTQVVEGEQFGWRIEIRPVRYFESREQNV